jgi:hypothetical protein
LHDIDSFAINLQKRRRFIRDCKVAEIKQSATIMSSAKIDGISCEQRSAEGKRGKDNAMSFVLDLSRSQTDKRAQF